MGTNESGATWLSRVSWLEWLLLSVGPLIVLGTMFTMVVPNRHLTREVCDQRNALEEGDLNCDAPPEDRSPPSAACSEDESYCRCALGTSNLVAVVERNTSEARRYGVDLISANESDARATRRAQADVRPIRFARFEEGTCVTFSESSFHDKMVVDARGRLLKWTGFSWFNASPSLAACLFVLIGLGIFGGVLVPQGREAEHVFGADGSGAATGEWAGERIRGPSGMVHAKRLVIHGRRYAGEVEFAPRSVIEKYRDGEVVPLLHVFSGTPAELRAFIDARIRRSTRTLVAILVFQWIVLGVAFFEALGILT